MAKTSGGGKINSTPLGNMSPLEMAELGYRTVECITSIIHTIGEERRKTEEAITERLRISADLEYKLSESENETVRLLGQYQVEMKKMAQEIEIAKIEAVKEMESNRNTHEERMLQITNDHERRMKQLDLIEKIIDTTLRQYEMYRSFVIITPQAPGSAPIINLELLDAMDKAVLRLNDTITRASLDAPLL